MNAIVITSLPLLPLTACMEQVTSEEEDLSWQKLDLLSPGWVVGRTPSSRAVLAADVAGHDTGGLLPDVQDSLGLERNDQGHWRCMPGSASKLAGVEVVVRMLPGTPTSADQGRPVPENQLEARQGGGEDLHYSVNHLLDW